MSHSIVTTTDANPFEFIKLRYQNRIQTNDASNTELKDFQNKLAMAFSEPDSFSAEDFSDTSISIILDYLKSTHAFYKTRYLNEITDLIEKLLVKDECQSTWKPLLQMSFEKYAEELVRHIDEEEDELFPYLQAIIDAKNKRVFNISFQRKLKLINHLLNHNDEAEQKLQTLIKLLEDNKEVFNSPMRLNMLLTKLKVFEKDLLIHAKMEDLVLLPKALQLEKEVLKQF